MRNKFAGLVTAASIGLLTMSTVAIAQSTFDPKKFFEELQKTGARVPVGFDPQKFFDDLQKQGGRVPPIIKLK